MVVPYAKTMGACDQARVAQDYALCAEPVGWPIRIRCGLLFLALVFLVAGVLSCTPGLASEVAYPSDPLEQIQRWDALLSLKPSNYSLAVVDTFEGELPYQSRAASGALDDIRFIFKKPDQPAYRDEMAMVSGWASGEVDFERSLFAHASFRLPGKEHYWLKASRPVLIQGQLLRASIWVHSNMYRHSLSLLFQNTDGRQVKVALGNLLWHGWRRLDVALPGELYRRGRMADKRYAHHFTGILVESHPLAEAGDFAIMLDNLLVLSDTKEFEYPGYEQADIWE